MQKFMEFPKTFTRKFLFHWMQCKAGNKRAFTAFTMSVFQITLKGRVPTRSFEGSIDVGLLHLIKFPTHFVGSGGQLSWVFDLRPLSYPEHCT